jgi:16S rRNA (guanine966-N2)-methyltransferase
VRIIAGHLGGRTFDSPRTFKTHPMSDKIRGALFNILGDIEGLTILDAFAGSGAVGFEAVSRGAKTATLIDNDRAAQKVIADNTRTLGLSRQVGIVTASANAWLQTNPNDRFDIVVCDPPYNDRQAPLVVHLTHCVAPEGIFVLSWPGTAEAPTFEGFKTVTTRRYGDAQLLFFVRVKA